MSINVVDKHLLVLKFVPNFYKAQETWKEFVNKYLFTLKLVTDWFVTLKLLEAVDNSLMMTLVITLASLLHDAIDINIGNKIKK